MRYKCSICGRYISKESKVCKHCGAENSSVPINTPQQSIPSKSQVRTMTCPHCFKEIFVVDESINSKKLKCSYCGGVFNNPYCKPSGLDKHSAKQKNWRLYLAISIILMIIIIIGSLDSRDNTPQLTKEWKVAAQNQNFTIENENEYNSNYLINIENETGKQLLSLFETYENKPQPTQEILTQEPLKTLLLSTYGADIFNELLLCRKSDGWVIKNNKNYINPQIRK